MLLSKDSIADVSEVLRGADFYRPVHEVIFDAIIDLYGRGEPSDPITVANELQRRGELARIGGAPYLHTLSANVPIAANAGYYAEIVREKAILRRLVDAGTRIVQMGYAGQGIVDDVVDAAQAEVYQVTDRRSSEDYAPLSDILDGVLDEIEAIGNRDGRAVRRAHRLRRPRRPHQRSAQRPDGDRRGPSRHGQGSVLGHPAGRPPAAGRRWARLRSVTCSTAPMAVRPRVVAATDVMVGTALLSRSTSPMGRSSSRTPSTNGSRRPGQRASRNRRPNGPGTTGPATSGSFPRW